MYDNLFFDADGTLFDFMSGERWALKRVFAQLKIEVGEEALERYSQINNAVWLDFEQGLISIEELKIERFRRFHRLYEIGSNPTESAEAYEEELSRSYHLYDDALPLLEHLSKSGIPLTMITNGISTVQRGRLAATGTLRYFSTIVISEEIGVQKPNKAYFEKALEMAKPANNPLVIGDSLTSDIAGANSVGLDSCWVNRYGMVNEEGVKRTYEITSLDQLLPLLNL